MATPHIALLIETSTSWGTRVIRGISQYAQEHGPWVFFLEPRGTYEKLTLPTGWKGDGVIARVTTQALADQLLATGLPSVNVSWYDYGAPKIARCTNNEKTCGRLAAEYFLNRGYRHYAYCGPLKRPDYVDRVREVADA